MARHRVLVTIPWYGTWSDAVVRLEQGDCEVVRCPRPCPRRTSYTPDNMARMELACAENVLRVLAGKPPLAGG